MCEQPSQSTLSFRFARVCVCVCFSSIIQFNDDMTLFALCRKIQFRSKVSTFYSFVCSHLSRRCAAPTLVRTGFYCASTAAATAASSSALSAVLGVVLKSTFGFTETEREREER